MLGMCGILLAGVSPLLYEPSILGSVEYAVVPTPVYVVAGFVSNYVVRQVALREVARRTSEIELRAERERAERLRRETETDGLTGISNRRHLQSSLSEELERSRRLGTEFAVLFADLDDFKAVNDEHGHLLGDDALRLVARTLAENARLIDVVARYGGEEFVALLPGTGPEETRVFYERIREDLARRSETELGFTLSLSAGAVGHKRGAESAESAESAEDLIEAADRAMYEAKRQGKDRVFVSAVS